MRWPADQLHTQRQPVRKIAQFRLSPFFVPIFPIFPDTRTSRVLQPPWSATTIRVFLTNHLPHSSGFEFGEGNGGIWEEKDAPSLARPAVIAIRAVRDRASARMEQSPPAYNGDLVVVPPPVKDE